MVGIARFSRERFGDARTEKYLADIEAAIDRAVADKRLRSRPDLGEGIFSVLCQSHVAFLTKPANGAQWIVVAVLHGRMDFNRHLKRDGD